MTAPARASRLALIVPTYNRAACLRLLLATLEVELQGLHERVPVLVSDNCSTDSTPDVVREFAPRLPAMRSIRHAENLGPDENFCRCVELVDADYFWIMGDDDLPAAGLVAKLLRLLDEQAPDLVNLRSVWRPELVDNDPAAPIGTLGAWSLGRLGFARRVNVWTTFISGIVVRRDTFVAAASAADLRRFGGSYLVQLSWVLGTLARGKTFLDLRGPCILATSGNTGGYRILQVFGKNFADIVGAVFGPRSPIARAMIRRCIIGFLPNLLWTYRFGHVGTFATEDPAEAMRPTLGGYAAFPLLLAIGHAPRPVATATLALSRFIDRVVRVVDRATSALAGDKRLGGH